MPCLSKWAQTPLGPFRAGPQTPLLQSSEILDLGLTAQIGNFWLPPWFRDSFSAFMVKNDY